MDDFSTAKTPELAGSNRSWKLDAGGQEKLKIEACTAVTGEEIQKVTLNASFWLLHHPIWIWSTVLLLLHHLIWKHHGHHHHHWLLLLYIAIGNNIRIIHI